MQCFFALHECSFVPLLIWHSAGVILLQRRLFFGVCAASCCGPVLCSANSRVSVATTATRRLAPQHYEASSSHAYACKHESSHLMPALLFELLNYISASSAQRIASGSVQAIRIRAAREPQESWSKARCIPCARSPDIKMLVLPHALGCRMDAREIAPSTRHGAVTAAFLRARSLHGCTLSRRETIPRAGPRT